jgi:hypothetical protein
MAAAAIPYIVMAVGTAASIAGQRRAANERRSILNRSFAETQQATDKATQLVAQEGANYTGATRQQAMQEAEASNLARELQDMQGAGATGANVATAGDTGAVSGDFVRAKADKALSEGTRMTAIARELAKTRAPGQLTTNEALRRADVGQTTGSIFGTAQNMANAYNLDAQSVQEPWWGTMGKLAATAASIYAMGAGGAAGAAGSSGAGASYGLSGAKLGDMASNGSSIWGKPVKFG